MTEDYRDLEPIPEHGNDFIADISVCSRCKKNPKHKESVYCIDCLYERKMSGY